MKTVVYLIRHSKPLKVVNKLNDDSLQLNNEKEILSLEGECIAKNKFDNDEFNNVNILFSSNYVRTIRTAKYLAEKNKLNINIMCDLDERNFGIDYWNDKLENFEEKQFYDENYKISNGECQKEVKDRMYNALMSILNKYNGKRIAIVTHSTATAFLLKKWCEIDHNGYRFKNRLFFDGKWEYCQTFKLTFENQKLTNIKVID